jgi:Na+/proline symporter/nitrogen-specific signal transduction histidine kinase
MRVSLVAFTALAYLASLFAVAWWCDRRAEAGRSLIRNPVIYTLSIAVYCTSWTFYGAVGTAARSGPEFLTIYLGPTIAFLGWWLVLRRIVRIGRTHRITSIADFLSSRFGKTGRLSAVVTVIATAAATPYIALQLKAVSISTAVLLGRPAAATPGMAPGVFSDIGFWAACGMGVFAILFGTRHIDAAERHEGVVAAIAFESAVKLIAFVAVGLFTVFGLFDGPADLLDRAAGLTDLAALTTLTGAQPARWTTVLLLSISAAVCLTRQFQVTIVEITDERHLRTASWLFPSYLIVISLFVLPIALAGLLTLPPGTDADTFVLTVPLAQGQHMLTLFAFLGGLSSATAMVIVEAIALSTMLCNDLVVPSLLRMPQLRLAERGDLTGLLLGIRRACIMAVVLVGYVYYRMTDQTEALATIGLVSFAAAAQLAPPMLAGLFWKGATGTGAQAGLIAGFAVWAYTLLVPSLARSGLIAPGLVDHGPFGWWLLRPEALFGLSGMEPLTHAMFWSWLANAGACATISAFTRPSVLERLQAEQFVDVLRTDQPPPMMLSRTATVSDLHALAQRFIGRDRAYRAFQDYAQSRGETLRRMRAAPPELVHMTERLLAGTIGAASARVMIGTVARGEMLNLSDMMEILDETSQFIEYTQQLRDKSEQLERTTAELRAANTRLQELDHLKDEFLSTVSHELRTPLTAIRSASEILADNRDLPAPDAERFLAIIASETQRLTRLIDQTLDIAHLASGQTAWRIQTLNPAEVARDAAAAVEPLAREKGVRITLDLGPGMVAADRDRLMQVFVNLLSNAVKFVPAAAGRIDLWTRTTEAGWCAWVADNGPGIADQDRERIFERFVQAGEDGLRSGTGLGLAISRRIITHFGGRITAEPNQASGALFRVLLPLAGVTHGEVPAALAPPTR